MHQGSKKIKEMPPAFTNVDEAKVYLELVTQRTMHFLAYTLTEKTHTLRIQRRSLQTANRLSKPLNFQNQQTPSKSPSKCTKLKIAAGALHSHPYTSMHLQTSMNRIL